MDAITNIISFAGKKLFLLLAITFFVFHFPGCYGQAPWKADSLANLFIKFQAEKPDSAFYIIEKGMSVALRENDSLSLAMFHSFKGHLYYPKSFKLALSNYFEAKKIYESLGNEKGLAMAYIRLSSVSTDQRQKMELALKAKDLADCLKDTFFMAHTLNNLGVILSDREDMVDSALYCYERGLKLAMELKDSNAIAMFTNNIGSLQIKKKNYQESIKNLHRSLRMSNDKEHILGSQGNLMSVYLDLNNLDSALFYYKLIEPDFERRPELALTYYTNFAAYYERTGDKAKAFDYFVKADSIEDTLAKDKDASTLNLLELEYQSQIQKERMTLLNAEIEKSEYIRYLLISIVCIILLSGGIIFYQYRQRMYKKREVLLHKKQRAEAEKSLMSEKLQHARLKSRHLSNQLKYTSNELAYMAASSAHNRELLSELKHRIEETCKKDGIRDIKDNLRGLNILLMQLINKDHNERLKLIDKAEDINALLISALREKFPELSDNDVKLLILMLLKFNSKDIASIYNVEERSVVMRRHRLRQKLNVEKYESFEDFLKRALPDIEITEPGEEEDRDLA